MRRYLVLVLVVILVGGCELPTPPPSPTPLPTRTPTRVRVTGTPAARATATRTPAATATPRTTEIVVWESLPPGQVEALAEDIAVFEDEFPYYKVRLEHYDSPEDFMTPLMAGETGFDVAMGAPVLLGSLWAAKQVAPMSDFFSASFMDSFASVSLEGAERGGEVWGLADTTGFHLLLFYNRDLVDRPPLRTADLMELAEELSKNRQARQEGPQWGLGVNSYDPLWVVPWLAGEGGWLTSGASRVTLDTPAMEAALSLYLTWHEPARGLAPVVSYEEMRTQFLAGEMAMMIDGEWALAELAGVTELEWGVAPLPAVGDAEESEAATPLVLSRYWAISRSASGDRAAAAAAFLEHVTRPERQLDWAGRFGLLPTRREALDDPVIVNDALLRVSAEQMLAGRTIPLGVNPDALLNAMREPLRGLLEGELTPAEAAEMMQGNVSR